LSLSWYSAKSIQ